MFKTRFWKNFDWILFGIAAALVIIGVLIIYATSFKAATLVSDVDAINQMIFATVGLAVLITAARIDYHVWARLTYVLYGLMLVLLLGVQFGGDSALGAQRWIDIGFFRFQPSEFAKLVLILFFAKYFADRYDRLDQIRHLLISLVWLAIPMGLVLIQPDLGTALVMGVIWLSIVVVARVRWLHLAGLFAVGIALLPLGLKLLKPYQMQRLQTFMNPTADPLSTGYNVVQAKIAVGSGQLTGRGLASGSQSQLNFLPSQHTDFIFAVLSEKMGFIGGLVIITLFAALLGRGMLVAARARDRFGMFVAVGIIAMLMFHAVVNIAMNIGLLPVTGIPLPFISYGGTSLLVSMASIGLLQSIAVRRHKIQFGG